MKNFTPSAILLVLLYIATTGNAFACGCAGNYRDFWQVVTPYSKNALVRFEEVVKGERTDYVYGKFTVLENYNATGFEVNDVITLSSDRTSCGANIQDWRAGDSFVVAVGSDLYLSAACDNNYMPVGRGYTGEPSLEEIKARIMILTSSPEVLMPQNNLIVYPNPATTFLTVKSPHAGKLPNKIEILDMSGRVVKTKESPDAEENLDIESLPTGLYMLRLSYNSTGIIMLKWVKA